MKELWVNHQNKFFIALIALLFGLYTFLLFYHLGVRPYIDWDESIYAQIARDALLNNHWFNFEYYGIAWYDKPPLGLWLVSWSFALGGINEFMGRLPSVLATIASIILSLRWVYEIRKKYLAVLLTMSAYFVMYPLLIDAYFLNLDTIIGLPVILSLYAWWKIFIAKNTAEKSKLTWYLVWGVSLGLGVMTKSIVGFFPLVPILLFSLAHRELGFLKDKRFWYGVLLSIIIIFPWHIYQSLHVGKEFWNKYLLYHVLNRYSTSLENNGAPFLFFIDQIFYRYREATAIFGGSVILSLYLSWKDKTIRFLLTSSLIILLIFSSSVTKLASYVAIVLPLFVMLAGLVLWQLVVWIPKNWLKVVVTSVLVVTLAYTGWQFNNFKIVKSESVGLEYDNKKIGLFLKDFHKELTVYISDYNYRNLAVAFYADRPVLALPQNDPKINAIEAGKQMVLHTGTQTVLLDPEYIVIYKHH